MKSKCCNYEVTVNYGEEGTNCWICGKCWEPCDICPQEPKPLTCEKHSRILIGKNKCVDCKEVGEVSFINKVKELIDKCPECYFSHNKPYSERFIKYDHLMKVLEEE